MAGRPANPESFRAPTDAVAFVRERLSALRDETKAAEMAAYMKTEQPFFGVSEPDRRPIFKELVARCGDLDASNYRSTVLALWAAGQWPNTGATAGERDYRYAACHVAETFSDHQTPAHLPLFRRLIVEGAWWDIVDWVAGRVVSWAVLAQRDRCMPVMRRWIDDESMWVRRAAILCQIKHKSETDADVLFEFCLRRADEPEFFIRKAIGWALREYAHAEPDRVRAFLKSEGHRISPLSFREAAKHLSMQPPAAKADAKPASRRRASTR
jgi:3-methyladenine DNA glycosylase AlkD